jgi:chromosome segregation ATPase
VLANYLKAV